MSDASNATNPTRPAASEGRIQGLVFGLLMSVTMTYGMEVYNNAWQMGLAALPGGFSNMTGEVFVRALHEFAFMCPIVFVISSLWGNKLGAHLSGRLAEPGRDTPFMCMLARSSCTVLVMCPTMSLVGSIIFSLIMAGASPAALPAIWVGNVIKNFPMALLWNLFFAGPVTRGICGKLFSTR